MNIISKQGAKAAGLSRFFNGVPCKEGHTDERYVANSACVGCSRTQGSRHIRTDKSKLTRSADAYKVRVAAYNSRHMGDDSRRAYTKNRNLQVAYGITTAEYLDMVAGQSNKCKICNNEFVGEGALSTAPCVDHCHTSGKVRSILCGCCNRMLGLAKENITTLNCAIKYLKSHL